MALSKLFRCKQLLKLGVPPEKLKHFPKKILKKAIKQMDNKKNMRKQEVVKNGSFRSVC